MPKVGSNRFTGGWILRGSFNCFTTSRLRAHVNEYIVREKGDTPKLSLENSGDQVGGLNKASEEPGIYDAIYYETPINKDWENAWQLTEKLVATMRDEVEATGAKFVVVTLSNSVQVTPSEDRRNEYMRQHGLTDLFAPDHKFAKICERESNCLFDSGS